MAWFQWFRRRHASGDQEVAPAQHIGGRARTMGVPYQMPADLEEMNRLDFQHFALRQAFKGLFFAPLQRPHDILDVGTGTGRWAIEMAKILPQANVVGTDINIPAVDERASSGLDIRPDNYTFVAGNVLEALPVPDASFDYVHERLLVSAIPADRWSQVMAELVRVTRLGGWIESVETVSPVHNGPAFDKIADWTTKFLASRGVNFALGAQVGDMMRGAGLRHVQTHLIRVPIGAWGGRLGRLMASDYLSGAKGIGGVVVARNLASAEEFEQAYQQAQADMATTRYHGFAPFYIAYGQRL